MNLQQEHQQAEHRQSGPLVWEHRASQEHGTPSEGEAPTGTQALRSSAVWSRKPG